MAFLYGVGIIEVGLDTYTDTPRILSIIAGGLIILASLLSWIKREISWVLCVMAFFGSFVLLEIRFFLTNQGWGGMFDGIMPLVLSLFLLQSNLRDLFFGKKE